MRATATARPSARPSTRFDGLNGRTDGWAGGRRRKSFIQRYFDSSDHGPRQRRRRQRRPTSQRGDGSSGEREAGNARMGEGNTGLIDWLDGNDERPSAWQTATELSHFCRSTGSGPSADGNGGGVVHPTGPSKCRCRRRTADERLTASQWPPSSLPLTVEHICRSRRRRRRRRSLRAYYESRLEERSASILTGHSTPISGTRH